MITSIMSLSKFRDEVGLTVNAVRHGEFRFVIERNGKPAAALIGMHEFEWLRAVKPNGLPFEIRELASCELYIEMLDHYLLDGDIPAHLADCAFELSLAIRSEVNMLRRSDAGCERLRALYDRAQGRREKRRRAAA